LQKGNRNEPNFPLKGRIVFFATGNINKFNEARSILSEYDIAVGMLRVKAVEIQSSSIRKIAEHSVTDAFNRCHLPVIVEDAGLFIEALDGFPGPYAAYAYKTVHNEGILKLMENIENRKASFQSAIAYCNSNTCVPILFDGEAKGEITARMHSEQGKSGFGFDPIFQPSGSKKTFAEMTIEEKNGFSHRAKALRKFAEWYMGLR
jgi:XTP/dITP diphosphohydrolase